MMLMNAGLFVLVWESVTVSVAAITRAFFPSFALYEMLVQAVIVLPIAFYLTTWIDRCFLSAADRALNLHQNSDSDLVEETGNEAVQKQSLSHATP